MLHMSPSQERLFPRPQGFRAARGVTWAEFSELGPYGTAQPVGHTEAQKIGLRYERCVHEELSRRYEGNYGPSQWISFKCGRGFDVRWAQPDGLLLNFDAALICIVEIKIRHSERAWWQLRQLYEPLVSFLFPSWRVALCEVCRSYDPAVAWPEPVRFGEPAKAEPGVISVYPWEAMRSWRPPLEVTG